MRLRHVFFHTQLLATLLGLVAFAQPGLSQVAISAWGYNNFYQLGAGAPPTDRPTPVTASVWTGPVKVLAGGGNRTVALKPDGTIWTWGEGDSGEAGNGGFVLNIDTPLQANLSGVADIAAGYGFTLALKGDGTLWSWGHNIEGQLGVGSCCAASSVPLQVNISGVSKIAGGYYHSLALKTDGTVWAWGRGDEGQLGNGNNLDSSSPVQVSGLTDVVAIATHVYTNLALKSDGTVWAWGYNRWGQLGNGTGGPGTDRNTPVQVTGLTGVKAVSGGYVHMLALKNDGTVWVWGTGGEGELGNGTNTTSSYIPIQVSNLTGVAAITAGLYHNLALMSGGTVWSWGYNDHGQVGDGTTINRFIPAQVSGLTNVTAIGAGDRHSLAVVSSAFVVNTTADTIDINPGDGICADATARCSLRAAIMESNALPNDDVITVPAGVYTLNIPGTSEDAAASGDLDITGNLTINGAGAATTIIDGGGFDRVFEVRPGATARLNAFTVRNGDAGAADGGGILNQGTISLTNSTLTNNGARGGGGITSRSGQASINNSTISRNNTYYYGSGVWNDGGALFITDSTVSGNTGGGFRDGAVVSTGGSATLVNATISGNSSSGQGAGGFLNWASVSKIINSTVSGNTGNGYGGGIVNIFSGTLTLMNVTVADNTDIQANPAPAGGIYTDSGTVTIKNTIIANNTVGVNQIPADCLNSIPMTSLGHNLAGDSTCGLGGSGDLNNTNPLLVPLASNGGPTMTRALQPGSPAIDAVPLLSCTGLTGAALTTDQRAAARPQGPACDIGAFELVPATTLPITFASSPVSRAFTVSGTGCQPGTYTAPQTLVWSLGSSCAVTFASPQSNAAGAQYAFTGWADGGIITNPRNIVTPSAATTYTANFQTQYQLNTVVSPVGSGTVTPVSGYQNAGPVNVIASPGACWVFSAFTGASVNSGLLTLNAPTSLTANFSPVAGAPIKGSLQTVRGIANRYRQSVSVLNSTASPTDISVILGSLGAGVSVVAPASLTGITSACASPAGRGYYTVSNVAPGASGTVTFDFNAPSAAGLIFTPSALIGPGPR